MKATGKVGVGAQGVKNAGKAMVSPKAKKGMAVSKMQKGGGTASKAMYGKTMKKGGAMKKGK